MRVIDSHASEHPAGVLMAFINSTSCVHADAGISTVAAPVSICQRRSSYCSCLTALRYALHSLQEANVEAALASLHTNRSPAMLQLLSYVERVSALPLLTPEAPCLSQRLA